MDLNFFEWFGLKPQINIDLAALRKSFLGKAKTFQGYSVDNETNNAYNNQAYTTLKDDNSRKEYILELYNIILKNENFLCPIEFLEKMMDINIELDSALMAKNNESGKKIQIEIENQMQALVAEDLTILGNKNLECLTTQEKAQLKTNFYIHKYLLRILERISNFASA